MNANASIEDTPVLADAVERAINFPAAAICALLEDRKTQDRRIVTPQPELQESFSHQFPPDGPRTSYGYSGWYPTSIHPKARHYGSEKHFREGFPADFCPFGKPGGRLWVRETFALESTSEYDGILDEGADSIPEDARDGRPTQHHVINADEGGEEVAAWYTVPRYRATEPDTLLMIKEAEQPEDQMVWTPSARMPRWASRITLEITGVRVERLQEISRRDCVAEGISGPYSLDPMLCPGPVAELVYEKLWESINGTGSWDVNPWVWVLAFNRINLEEVYERDKRAVHN